MPAKTIRLFAPNYGPLSSLVAVGITPTLAMGAHCRR